MGQEETIQQAWAVIEQYATELYFQATGQLEKEFHGDGCGCNSCKLKALRDKNWVDRFVSAYGEPQFQEWMLDQKGKLVQDFVTVYILREHWWLNAEDGDDGVL